MMDFGMSETYDLILLDLVEAGFVLTENNECKIRNIVRRHYSPSLGILARDAMQGAKNTYEFIAKLNNRLSEV